MARYIADDLPDGQRRGIVERRCGKGRPVERRSNSGARIIPCSTQERTLGGQFRDHRDAGDIIEHAMRYAKRAPRARFYESGASKKHLDLAG